ncbi:uncharacterized protein BDW70DRAFT_140867 [Aspergillus foveolatus]|uniref:uncharacterized protein n=1 Tax=Aspergillus foveolatus TaxID=210207 RepID=UPI003CCD8B0A
MPIPTRSVSTRETRKQPAANVGRTVSNLKPSATSQLTDEAPSKTEPTKIASSNLTRRQSLVRPSQLRIPSSAKPTILPTSTRTVGRIPTSPVKRNETVRQRNGEPVAPKKTDMPPPARPVRSSSLRQPTRSSTVTSTAPRGHARHQSQIVTPSSKNLAMPSTATSTASRTRNQFSTYQQQFSPKKAQEPTVSTPDNGPDQVSSLIPSSWPEVAALQTELLQLSLLHQSMQQRNDQWERDAQAHLREKYNSVAGDYKAILNEEKESQRKLNGQALHSWFKNSGEHNGQQRFAEHVRLLSQVADEVYGLSDSHGRYTMAIIEFEEWLQTVEKIQEARANVGQEGENFIDPIRREWREETNALIMKLELASRQLQSLDILGHEDVEALNRSALIRMAKGLGDLVSQMVEELNVIRKIEADCVKSERTRVSQMAQQLVEMRPIEEPAMPRTGLWTRPALKS